MNTKRRPEQLTTLGPTPQTSGFATTDEASIKPRYRRCGKRLNRKTAIWIVVGVFCKRHGDHIAPHLYRAGGGS